MKNAPSLLRPRRAPARAIPVPRRPANTIVAYQSRYTRERRVPQNAVQQDHPLPSWCQRSRPRRVHPPFVVEILPKRSEFKAGTRYLPVGRPLFRRTFIYGCCPRHHLLGDLRQAFRLFPPSRSGSPFCWWPVHNPAASRPARTIPKFVWNLALSPAVREMPERSWSSGEIPQSRHHDLTGLASGSASSIAFGVALAAPYTLSSSVMELFDVLAYQSQHK